MKTKIIVLFSTLLLVLSTLCYSCKKDSASFNQEDLTNPTSIFPAPPTKWLQFGGTTYNSSGFVGDVMPYFDNGKFYIYYLHDGDGASDANGGGFHPIHAFETSDFLHYSYDGKMINYSNKNDQDMALGTGSVIKVGSTYYFYYTGHNGSDGWVASHPAETIRYATSSDLKTWTKKDGFNLQAPNNYDKNNFRDPYLFFNKSTNEYWMLVTARNNNNAVITLFTSTNPATDNWISKGPIYASTNTTWGNLECPDLFQMGNNWYLIYSDQESSTVKYLVGTNPNGPFTAPVQNNLDGSFFYGARTETDGTNRYLFGWNYRKDGATDYGSKVWGGNLIVRKLVQNSDGTLSTSVLDAINNLFNKSVPLQTVDMTNATANNGNFSIQNGGTVHFPLINGQKRIATTISGLSANTDAGILLGWARPNNGDYYKVKFKNGIASIVKVQGVNEYEDASIPYTTTDNTLKIELLIDNSTIVVTINGKTTLTGRSYWMNNAQWGLYATSGNVTFNQLTLSGY